MAFSIHVNWSKSWKQVKNLQVQTSLAWTQSPPLPTFVTPQSTVQPNYRLVKVPTGKQGTQWCAPCHHATHLTALWKSHCSTWHWWLLPPEHPNCCQVILQVHTLAYYHKAAPFHVGWMTQFHCHCLTGTYLSSRSSKSTSYVPETTRTAILTLLVSSPCSPCWICLPLFWCTPTSGPTHSARAAMSTIKGILTPPHLCDCPERHAVQVVIIGTSLFLSCTLSTHHGSDHLLLPNSYLSCIVYCWAFHSHTSSIMFGQ